MADILIRGLTDELNRRIDQRAALHGNSLSREIALLIERALSEEEASENSRDMGLGTRISQLVPPAEWTDEFIVERDKTDREPPDFS